MGCDESRQDCKSPKRKEISENQGFITYFLRSYISQNTGTNDIKTYLPVGCGAAAPVYSVSKHFNRICYVII
jgi:hypothetical protein